MFNLGKAAVLGAILAVSAPFASAVPFTFTGSINTAGAGTFVCPTVTCQFTDTDNNATSVVVGSTGTLGLFNAASSGGVNTVTFANFSVTPSTLNIVNPAITISTVGGSLGTTKDYLYFNATGVVTGSLIYPAGGPTIYVPAGSVVLTGTLSDSLGLFASTSALFTFAETGNGASFTDSELIPIASSTPEPNSLILLGTGLVSAGGMLVRRRRIAA